MAENDSSKSSKKLKQKKIPQRGLGVAQLEKIRFDEQQKKNGGLQSVLQNNNPILVPNYRQNSYPDINSNSFFKTNLGSGFSNKQSNIGQGGWCKLWNGEHRLESGGLASGPKTKVDYGSIPVLSSPSIPTNELFQLQNSSSSMVKVSSGTSSSSSGITFNQMEPPSNQSFHSKIYTSISKWPEDEKLIGIKRASPFSLDNLRGPAYPRKFSPLPVLVEPEKAILRERPASLSVRPEMRTETVAEKYGNLNGDFLTLALPRPPSPHLTQELSEAGKNSQENVDVPSFYSFFPTSDALNGQANNITSCSGEVAENIDLNLKL